MRISEGRSILGRTRELALTVLDQAFFGLGGYVVSWSVARWLQASELAAFAIAWQWAFGMAAVLSEVSVTPAMVRVAGSPKAAGELERSMVRTFGTASAAVGGMAVMATAFDHGLGDLVLWAATLTLAVLAHSAFRGMRYARRDFMGSVQVGAARATLAGGAITLWIVSGHFGPAPAVSVGVVATLVPLLLIARGVRTIEAFKRTRAAVVGTYREGATYGLASVIRVLGFSAGMLSLVALVRGVDEAAVLAGFFIVAGPAQMLSASLPLLFIAELSPVPLEDGDKWRSLLSQQASVLAVLLSAALGASWFVFDAWVELSIGDSALQGRLSGEFAAFALFVAGLTCSTWVGAIQKSRREARLYAISGGLAAAVTLAAVWSPLTTLTLAWAPYWITVLALGQTARKLR